MDGTTRGNNMSSSIVRWPDGGKSLPDSSLLLEVARGNVKGSSISAVRGYNASISTATKETLWDQGGLYTYLAADTELFLSSSSAVDTNVGVIITGLTSDYELKTVTITLTSGQTQLSVGLFFRVFRVIVVAGAAPLGDLYLAESGSLTAGVPDNTSSIKNKVVQGINVSRSGLFTVPINTSMYIYRHSSHTRKNKDAVVLPLARLEGFPDFIEVTQFPTFQSSFESNLVLPVKVNAKTDFELRSSTDTNGTEVVAAVDYLLIEDD